MSRAEKIRGKVFGGGDKAAAPDDDASVSRSPDAPLTISIPKPPPTQPAPPQKSKQSDSSPGPTADAQQRDDKCFRERLIHRLGEDYSGAERYRLSQDARKDLHWKRWGPYLSDRQWATVREDYSADGDAWSHFPHDHARSRAYRWGEDGIAGISDNHQRLCLALSLWNGEDPILKERFFGVTGHQGNHGEDVKELYYYLDSTPTHSYMKFLYKYPQRRYPYEQLVRENANRGRDVPEFEILDTDAFDDDRYWDIFVEYAKDEQTPENIHMRITTYNRGPEPATLHVIPQLWFPNSWSWDQDHPPKPSMYASGDGVITAKHETLGQYHLYCIPSPPPVDSQGEEVTSETDMIQPELLFTENNTNYHRLYGGQNDTPYVKDGFHDHIVPSHRPPAPEEEDEKGYFMSRIHSQTSPHRTVPSGADESETPPNEREQGPRTPFPGPTFVNPEKKGTKAAAHYTFRDVPPRGGCAVARLTLTPLGPEENTTAEDEGIFDDTVEERREEADEFYAQLVPGPISDDFRQIMRQAFGGMLWTKQYYQFVQKTWIEGDPAQPPPPPERKWIRNRDWKHLYIADILSMPDKWEYPFFAAWDTAFHCIPLAVVDPAFAKRQLDLLTREWYMKPDGQIPAYEWNFGDVNPPVHAW